MSLADYACADEPAHVFAYWADCLTFLRSLPDDWTHAIITDPPYGLADHKASVVATALVAWAAGDRERVPTGRGFMGREWDAFVPPPAVWDECLRVLKPGGHLAVFAGSRTVDLMGLSIRLAGFEVRDSIATWLYSQGMPKARTVLKGAQEPILLARKPFRGSAAACVAAHGTGALQVEACRVESSESTRRTNRAEIGYGGGNLAEVYETGSDAGRWPTNVVLAHHPDCGPDEAPGPCAPECHVAELDEQSGTLTSGANPTRRSSTDIGFTRGTKDQEGCHAPRGVDTGSASRFFPTFRYQAKAPKTERPIVDGTGHPTVKPLGLMRWLVRLLVPGEDGEGGCGAVLDPFAGSGATLEAARLEGRRAIGVERDEHSVRLIAERLGVEYREPPATEPVREATPIEALLEKVDAAGSVDVLMELYQYALGEGLWADEVKAVFSARKLEIEGAAA